MKKTVCKNETLKSSTEITGQLESLFEALQKSVEAFENMEDDGSDLYEAASAYVEAVERGLASRACLYTKQLGSE